MNMAITDRERRLIEMTSAIIAVDAHRVNIDDLLYDLAPGFPRIVRCVGDPRECITILSTRDEAAIGCVAGWISDEESAA